MLVPLQIKRRLGRPVVTRLDRGAALRDAARQIVSLRLDDTTIVSAPRPAIALMNGAISVRAVAAIVTAIRSLAVSVEGYQPKAASAALHSGGIATTPAGYRGH